MSVDAITTDGHRGARSGREATTGANVPPGGGGPRRRPKGRREPELRSYYDLPVVNKPVWEGPDIPGYLFLGGLAGAGAGIGVAARFTGRPHLSTVSKLGAAAAGHLSLVALVHDLGRRGRFLNMLRMFKVTSPMSVGSWLLAGFVPSATAAAFCDATGTLPALGTLSSVASSVLGLPVATYTAALISNTAVPAWHDGYEYMPFIFVSSAASSAAGLGLLGAPVAESAPLVPLAAAAGIAEVLLSKRHEEHIGIVKEAFHEGKAEKYMKAAEVLTVGGSVLAAVSGLRRKRSLRAAAGAMLLAGSCLTRFGIFEAGISSTQDPSYTVVPQRERLERRRSGGPR